MTKKFTYHDISKQDLDAVLNLIHELAYHEGRPEAVSITKPELSDLLFDDIPVAHGIVGVTDGNIVGYALLALKFSSFKGYKVAYIEDVLVSKTARGMGLGLQMMQAIIEKAGSLGCKAIEWSALDDNEIAIGFYDYLKAVREVGRIHFELDHQGMTRILDMNNG